MPAGLLVQATGSSGKKIKKGTKVRWGKMSKVSPSVKEYVKKAVKDTQETKFHDVFTATGLGLYNSVNVSPMSAVAPAGGAVVLPLNQFPKIGTVLYHGATDRDFFQGVNNDEHVGDSITCNKIEVRGKFVFDPAAYDVQSYLIMVVKESECADRTDLSVLSDMTLLHTQDDVSGFPKMDYAGKLKNLKVIKNRMFYCSKDKGDYTHFKFTVKVDKKLTYEQSDLGAYTYKDRYWLLIWSGSYETSSTNNVRIQARMFFKDA